MRAIFLGSDNSNCDALYSYLVADGVDVTLVTERINAAQARALLPDVVVSYNYRYILPKDIFGLPPGGAVNLHISYLPWNKGADPNFWSIVEDTPKGTSLHYIDEGIDTGDIIAQRYVELSSEDTLRTSYEKLHREIQELFYRTWPKLKRGNAPRAKQEGEGSFHVKADIVPLRYLIEKRGWDTLVGELTNARLDHADIHKK